MNSLPTEILSSIFTHLPQRYATSICSTVCKKWNDIISQPSFFSTINIYSERHLKKIIQLAKKKEAINDKPNGYYIKHIVFHYMYIQEDDDATELLVFPNLQSVDGLCDIDRSVTFYKSIYLRLNQPTYFPYCHHDEEWIIKFNTIKNDLKSLNLCVTEELIDYIPQQEHEQFDPIYLKTIGIKKINMDETLPTSLTRLPIKMLFLSTTSLVNLTNLYINFYCRQYKKCIINEYTFENIHQSCPSLESLSVEDLHMDIFNCDDNKNEYIVINDKKPYKPASRLKKFNIFLGYFEDPRCFSYFGVKYPNLEYLSLDFISQAIEQNNKSTFLQTIFNMLQYPLLKIISQAIEQNNESTFQQAIFNMLLQYPLLKTISFYPGTYSEQCSWLHQPFIKWLYEHPNQLTHLDYNYYLVKDDSLKSILLYDEELTLEKSLQQQLPPVFLNHLTSLSVTIDSIVLLASVYFSQNVNTSIMSSVLENLYIEAIYEGPIHNIYIYDWLDVFPNLISLKLKNFKRLIVNKDSDDDDKNQYSKKLHQLIKERKQQQQQQHDNMNKENEVISYKLENLEIRKCKIWYRKGLNELLKICQQLKSLKITQTTFIDSLYPYEEVRFNHPAKYSIDEVYFDLSHLHLEYLCFNHIFYSPNNNPSNAGHLEKLILNETSVKNERIIVKDRKENIYHYFNLHVKCKYIDEIVFDR